MHGACLTGLFDYGAIILKTTSYIISLSALATIYETIGLCHHGNTSSRLSM